MTEQEKSYSQMRKDFYEKYRTKIIPTVRKYEKKRQEKLCKAIIISSSLALIATFLLFYMLLHGIVTIDDIRPLKLPIMLYVGSFVAWKWIKKSFENVIKNQIMSIVCDCYGNIKWSSTYLSDGEVFYESGVMDICKLEKQSIFQCYDDSFDGSYKGVHFEIAEVEQYEIQAKFDKQNIFQGVIVKLDMNKPFTSHTVIKPNSLLHVSPALDLHRTELEDVRFNEKFDVFTNDEVDARYLITPSFMERLKNMKVAFRANSVSCAFFGNLLIVALPTKKDLFSICSLVKPIDDYKQYYQMYEEIVSIIKLIDHFKLNQKIGL